MDILSILIQIFLLVLIIGCPIITVLKGYGYIRVNIISLPLIFIFLCLIAYWPQFYTDLKLELIGFDFDAMNDTARTINVSQELKEEAIRLYWSNMGLGWPLKAMLAMVFLIPYPSIIYGFKILINVIKRRVIDNIT